MAQMILQKKLMNASTGAQHERKIFNDCKLSSVRPEASRRMNGEFFRNKERLLRVAVTWTPASARG